MVNVQLVNWNKGRNQPTFRPFLSLGHLFSTYGINIVDSKSNILCIGMADFIDKKKSLEESVEYGVNNIRKILDENPQAKRVFLFDGSDSTSIMGAYEVFEQMRNDVEFLFKPQKLKTKNLYLPKYPHGKWFWKKYDDVKYNSFGYDLSNEMFDRIKLTGWNLGYYTDYLHNRLPIFDSGAKQYDVCAVYQSKHDYNTDFNIENSDLYTKHRQEPIEYLKNTNLKYIDGKLAFDEYVDCLVSSRICISPFGMGEICFRDFECVQYGVPFIKMNMDNVDTYPNFYTSGITYVSCNDWSELPSTIEKYMDSLGNNLLNEITRVTRDTYSKLYNVENIILYWKKILNI